VTRAAAWEILAHLALRDGDRQESFDRARQSFDRYLRAGSMAGAEGIYRLLGLAYLEAAKDEPDADKAKRTRSSALRHLLVSHQLAEFLRDQVPADRIGLGRAGFFARRAYVYERIAELLIEEGRHAQALHFVELAKARGLQDVLAAGGKETTGSRLPPRELSEILADWPEDVAAMEYFLGTQRTWLFVVDTAGRVKAHVLRDDRGRPLASRDLVERTQKLLARMDNQAVTMRERLAAGGGFDHSWQHELHWFYGRLVPAGVLQRLREAQTVLVVPHHVLHYFPFTALVTETDKRRRTIHEMVTPRFLLEERFSLCHVPSLATWDLMREQADTSIDQVQASGIVDFPDAPPLPGVRKDLDNLQAVFGDLTRIVVPNDAAGESRAKQLLRRRGMLFLATHGTNFADRPLASYLLFRPDDAGDGYLTAREIYAGDVHADLVVMSACYSGLADRSPLPGDDLFGLQRALLHAGARTVVSGLWDVYDGTGPLLMRGLFEELAAGKPVPVALANSQRALLTSLRASGKPDPWLHPYFWAVYTAAGDDRVHFEPSKPEA
jgi:hypothetical protein